MKTKLVLSLLLLFQLNTFSQPSIQWQKSLGGSGGDEADAIQQTTDGGYIVAGRSASIDGDVTGNHGGVDFWIVKLNSAGNIQWQKSLGGSGDDLAWAIQQTTDGGYIIAGQSASTNGDVTGNYGSGDYWIVKLDSTGNIQWQKSLGGSGFDYAYAIQQTTDGGFIVAGYSNSTNGDITFNHGGFDYWIVKLDSVGNIQWQKSLGGSGHDEASDIQQTADGGYIVAGYSDLTNGDVTGNHGNSDYWIVKLDSVGNIQWQKSIGGSGDDKALAIQQTTDGGYIAAGFSNFTDGDVTGNHGSYDYWVVKIDSTGNIQWQKSLAGSDFDIAFAIQQTNGGGYIVAGYSRSTDSDVTSNHGSFDYWIVKLDSVGNIQWQKSLGGSGDDVAYAVQQTTDGGYIVAGYSTSMDGDVTGNNGGSDYWIVKLSPNVGVHELSASENSFTIYPNPCANRFTISFSPAFAGSPALGGTSLKIFNVMGEEVYATTVNNRQETINTNLSSGIYFVKVRADEKQFVQKIIIE